VTPKEGSPSLNPLPTSTPVAYSEVAAHLRNLASQVKSPEARVQFAALAALYEKLATQSARLGDVYLPIAVPQSD
jgi:hypothetical protein